VNPRDKTFVRSVMENLSESDANLLQSFGPGQGLVSGQAVRFPLLVKVGFDDDLLSSAIGDEDFIDEAKRWERLPMQAIKVKSDEILRPLASVARKGAEAGESERKEQRATGVRRPKKRGIRPRGF
jgi:hypothetical protein